MLGMVAAVAVAFLFAIFTQDEEKTVEILVADANLPANTIVAEEQLKLEKMPEKALPVGWLAYPTQATGKVLTIGVTKGQPITASLLRPKNRLEDFLEPNEVTVTMECSKVSGSDLLEPGSIVDLTVRFPLRDRELGETLVISGLLQQLRVLKVGNKRIGLQTEEQTVTSRSSSRDSKLTLAVTKAQESVVLLAQGTGTVSLPLRKSSDREFKKVQPAVLKDGKMLPFGELLDPQDPAGILDALGEVPVGEPEPIVRIVDANEPDKPVEQATPSTRPVVEEQEGRPRPRTGDVTILYPGSEPTTVTVPKEDAGLGVAKKGDGG